MRGKMKRFKLTCKYGHNLTPENVIMHKSSSGDVYRVCKKCKITKPDRKPLSMSRVSKLKNKK
jgi:hypothetical protein